MPAFNRRYQNVRNGAERCSWASISIASTLPECRVNNRLAAGQPGIRPIGVAPNHQPLLAMALITRSSESDQSSVSSMWPNVSG